MSRGFLYAMIGALVVLGVALAAGPIQRRFSELRSDQALISGDTGDVMASATYRRFKASREGIAAMREDLRRLAQAESAFIADSGRPTTLVPGYATQGRGSIGPTIQVMQDRWIGTMTNALTTAMCQVTGMLDTAGRQQGSADVTCLGTAAVESAWAVAQREEASRAVPPAPVAPEPDQPTAPPEPHKTLDWGPVNNTPPRMPFIVRESCEGEGCIYRGGWAACSTIVARREKRLDAPPVFTIQPGERFLAVTGDVHVVEPGMVVFRHPYTATIVVDEAGIVDVRFTPADTLFVLNYYGEGAVTWRFRGNTIRGDEFWSEMDPPAPTDTFALVRPAKTVWWVRVSNAAGQEGWIVGDFYKMATGGYMDEVERCLHPAKG